MILLLGRAEFHAKVKLGKAWRSVKEVRHWLQNVPMVSILISRLYYPDPAEYLGTYWTDF